MPYPQKNIPPFNESTFITMFTKACQVLANVCLWSLSSLSILCLLGVKQPELQADHLFLPRWSLTVTSSYHLKAESSKIDITLSLLFTYSVVQVLSNLPAVIAK